ncbi:hypothetical protein [Bacteroides sp.]|uniref:hypothetical protein n=1 Tax=Bacteroides sp. TaxID=29523 RepID=UPI0026369A7A|nr:hypothetical protein [Bacteroides sp.]MDD3038597.1 hypothetical protein [Bacteroides sp.]
MKKLLVAVAMVLGMGTSVAFAQEVKDSTVVEAQTPQDEFVKIDANQLPEAVMKALSKDYEGASIKEAFAKGEEGSKIYKVIVLTKEGQEVEVLLNEKGEAVKE